MADAKEVPSHDQMIREMQAAGFRPAQANASPSHEQMIAEMQAAGFVPGGGTPLGPIEQARADHPILNKVASLASGGLTDMVTSSGVKKAAEALPLAGSLFGGAVGALGGTAAAPGPGTIAGEVAGSAAGGAAGSAAKDALNNWLFKGTKSAEDIAKDAGVEGAISGVSQLVGGAVTRVGAKVLGAAAAKVVPPSVIARYQKAADAVKALFNSSDGDIAVAADQVKEGMQTSLDDFRDKMNDQIAGALKNSRERINGMDIAERLENSLKGVDKDLRAGEANKITELIKKVRSKFDENGHIFLSDANELKRYMQEEAKNAYRLAGESGTAGEYARIAKDAGGFTRRSINLAGKDGDAVAAANNKLAALHEIEDTMNKSLIRSGKTESGLVAAGKYSPGGTEGNATHAKALKDLGEIVGQDFLGGAQDLAAMKVFSGSSLTKRGVGAGVGAAVGAGAAEVAGSDPSKGAMIGGALGGALTSPGAVKFGLDAARMIPAQVVTPARQTLGQSVLRGTGAINAIRKDRQP